VHRRALNEDHTDTSMSSGNDLIVKGNQVAVPLERLWMSIDNENEEVN